MSINYMFFKVHLTGSALRAQPTWLNDRLFPVAECTNELDPLYAQPPPMDDLMKQKQDGGYKPPTSRDSTGAPTEANRRAEQIQAFRRDLLMRKG